MPDSKHIKWVDDYATDAKPETEKPATTVNPDQPAANDADGWQQYRHWISKAPAPRGRRVSASTRRCIRGRATGAGANRSSATGPTTKKPNRVAVRKHEYKQNADIMSAFFFVTVRPCSVTVSASKSGTASGFGVLLTTFAGFKKSCDAAHGEGEGRLL